jgi:hypothetical protein
MELTTQNPNDRDSPYYLQNLRDWEYQGLIDIARENLLLGVNVILVGPFSNEIQSGRMFDPEALGIPSQTKISIAWINLNEDEAKIRMEKRADPRDEWKLAHWNEYVTRRIDPPQHSSIHHFDNLQFNQDEFEKLVDKLIK